MGQGPESWGTMPLDELMALLQRTTGALAEQYEELALDEAAYQRRFWSTWQKLPEGMSVAAMSRECEMDCRALDEARILARSLLEGRLAQRDAMVAILAARAK